ncbi:hypothetical protein ACJD0Z_06135 [Flavobacteriaceae bacterium M23B6Z8]
MKKIVGLLFILWVAGLNAQKTIYESVHFEKLSKEHEVIAIIPFIATLELDTEEYNVSDQELDELEKQEGLAVQDALESYFLQRKSRKKFSVEFQDVQNTNAILAKNNITLDNIDIYTTQELCEILEVDALVSGNLTLSALISKGVPEVDFISIILGKSDFGRIAVKISDGESGKLLWKYEKTINRKSGKNTKSIIESMMKTAARKFPYDKDKDRKKKD